MTSTTKKIKTFSQIIMPSNINTNNKNKMEKRKNFRKTKILAIELGLPVDKEKSLWIGSTNKFWQKRRKKYEKQLKNRDAARDSLFQVAEADSPHEHKIPFFTKGTGQSFWRKKLRNLRAKIKRRKDKDKKSFDKLLDKNKFNEIIEKVIDDVKVLTERQAGKMYNKIFSLGRYVMTMIKDDGETKTVMFNDTTKIWFSDLMTMGTTFTTVEKYGSDIIDNIVFDSLKSVTVRKLEKAKRVIKNKDGKFFAFINTTNIDLLEYQIFNQDQAYDEKITKSREHCLLHTLTECGISEAVVNSIKMSFAKDCNIKKKDLKKVSEMINKNINLHYYDVNNKKQIQKIKCNEKETIDIALYESHYFPYKLTEYSKFSISNYEELKEVKDFKNIVRKLNKKYVLSDSKARITSLAMVHKLFKQGHFKKLDLVRFSETAKHSDLKDHIYLDNIENEQREFTSQREERKEPVKKKPKKPTKYFFADTETYVNGDQHVLQLLGVVGQDSDLVTIMNVNDELYKHPEVSKEQMLAYNFQNQITKSGTQNAVVYFHNLKYDDHILAPYLNITGKCQKDNQVYSVKVRYKKANIEFRCSYKLLPFPLSKFQSNFNLPKEISKKEAISYTYYTEENNNKRCDILDYCNLLNRDQQLIFMKNIENEPSFNTETQTFNPMTYYTEYLRLDCLVLKKGIEKFDVTIKEITQGQLSVYDCLTISSLTDKYMKMEGAYDGVYEVCGNLRAYIAKAVYGGRVSVNKKYQKKVIEGKIADYDGVSLYPSASNRLCRETGLPMGSAKRLLNSDLLSWEDKDYSVLTVKINKVNKIQQMPFIAHKNEFSIKYLNEAPSEPIIIDSTTLQDYIKFQKIDYEVLEGVYWDEGYNKKMGQVIQRLFKTRLKFKKSNPALANVIKLMLNSSYGKTIMKKTNTDIKIVANNDKFDSYIYNNFNTIKSYRKINDKCIQVEKICADSSYNRGHIGCSILSMSKRIMNELFDVANDLGKPIYYTDTDSLHCNLEDIPEIEVEYEKRYNKVLTGKQLEQFHTDFDLDDAVSEIYATKSIFLGKKSYIDFLESTDEDGKTITGYHIRLKGITSEGMKHTAKTYSSDNRTPEYFKFYEDLAKGTEKSIILNPYNPDENSNKVLFEFKKGRVSTRKEFKRRIKF